MYNSPERYYLYHAYALAAGGFVTSDGNRQNIESAASVVLSMSGGSGHVNQTGYRFLWCGRTTNFYIRIAESECEVVGYEDSEGYHTRSKSILRGVDINGVITADVIESAVESLHTTAGCAAAPHHEPAIELLNSRFEGLKISGVSFDPQRSDVFNTCLTYDSLKTFIAGTNTVTPATLLPRFREASLMALPANPPLYASDMCNRFIRNDVIRCSIFDPVNGAGLSTCGASLEVADFGRIYLGELVVTKGMKRLNMIRFDLGCNAQGGGTFGGSAVNGEPMP